MKDQDILREFVYGIGNDKVSYLRTDDYGISWKAVSPYEFETVTPDDLDLSSALTCVLNPLNSKMRDASSKDSTKFISRFYSALSVSSVPDETFGSSNQWTGKNNRSFGSQNRGSNSPFAFLFQVGVYGVSNFNNLRIDWFS